MAIEYLGLSEINGPLVVLEGVQDAAFDEIVEFKMDDGTKKIGRIVEVYEDKAVIQVFEGTVIAKKALEKGITTVIFDRGGFVYHGKIQALADAAREAGLEF